MPLIYCQLGDYMLPTTLIEGTRKLHWWGDPVTPVNVDGILKETSPLKFQEADGKIKRGLVIQSNLFGMVKTWPFEGVFCDLQRLGDEKVTNWITWGPIFLERFSFPLTIHGTGIYVSLYILVDLYGKWVGTVNIPVPWMVWNSQGGKKFSGKGQGSTHFPAWEAMSC